MSTPAAARIMPDEIDHTTPPDQVRTSLADAFRTVADHLDHTETGAFDLGHTAAPQRAATVYVVAEVADAMQHLTAALRHTRPDLAAVTGLPPATVGALTTSQHATALQALRSPGFAQLLRAAGA